MRDKEGFSLGMCSAYTSQTSRPWVALGSPVLYTYITIYLGFTWHIVFFYINDIVFFYINDIVFCYKKTDKKKA